MTKLIVQKFQGQEERRCILINAKTYQFKTHYKDALWLKLLNLLISHPSIDLWSLIKIYENTLNINSHSPTNFSLPANLTTYTILFLYSLHVEPAPHLLSPWFTSSWPCHLITVINFAVTIYLSLDLSLKNLKLIFFTNPFLRSHSYSFRTTSTGPEPVIH